MSEADLAGSVEARLAYTLASDVGPDAERPGLLRARTRPVDSAPEFFDHRTVRAADIAGNGAPRPELLRHGFECVDLSGVEGLRGVLERVRDAGRAREEDASELRRLLTGRKLRLGDGSRVRLRHVAREGFIMRRAGPNGMGVGPGRSLMNDHDAALAVHADQDVGGTPLRQIMRGAAPWLLRHDAPDSRNHWSPLVILNLWIPLQQITRPLALMDKRSLDRRAHQLRYGLPVESILGREEEDQKVNDIWTFLPDARQCWYFHSDMPLGSAYLFETLGTPHGSFIVPGEAVAERRVRRLDAACDALEAGDEPALRSAVASDDAPDVPIATAALRRAIGAMDALLAEARRDAAALCRGTGAPHWCARARRAKEAVIRKSLEMRVVAVRTPRLGLGPRAA